MSVESKMPTCRFCEEKVEVPDSDDDEEPNVVNTIREHELMRNVCQDCTENRTTNDTFVMLASLNSLEPNLDDDLMPGTETAQVVKLPHLMKSPNGEKVGVYLGEGICAELETHFEAGAGSAKKRKSKRLVPRHVYVVQVMKFTDATGMVTLHGDSDPTVECWLADECWFDEDTLDTIGATEASATAAALGFMCGEKGLIAGDA